MEIFLEFKFDWQETRKFYIFFNINSFDANLKRKENFFVLNFCCKRETKTKSSNSKLDRISEHI